jgi:hypothetical protein
MTKVRQRLRPPFRRQVGSDRPCIYVEETVVVLDASISFTCSNCKAGSACSAAFVKRKVSPGCACSLRYSNRN